MVFGTSDGAVAIAGGDLSHDQIMDMTRDGDMWVDQRFPADDPRSIYVTGQPASGKPYVRASLAVRRT